MLRNRLLCKLELAATMALGGWLSIAAPALGQRISDAAYPLLAERVMANRTSFFVYQDADSGLNHGFPSGFFGNIDSLQIDPACLDDPASPTGCATDTARLDRRRGTG